MYTTMYVISFNNRCEIDLMAKKKKRRKRTASAKKKKKMKEERKKWKKNSDEEEKMRVTKDVNRIGCILAGKSIQRVMRHVTSTNQSINAFWWGATQ